MAWLLIFERYIPFLYTISVKWDKFERKSLVAQRLNLKKVSSELGIGWVAIRFCLKMLKWAWSMLVLKICFLFSLLTTYQNVKGRSSCSCSAFPLPAFMSAQFVFHSLPAPRAAPAAALARLSLGVRLLSTFHLAARVPCCTAHVPFSWLT